MFPGTQGKRSRNSAKDIGEGRTSSDGQALIPVAVRELVEA
jgi:hypothetical protein